MHDQPIVVELPKQKVPRTHIPLVAVPSFSVPLSQPKACPNATSSPTVTVRSRTTKLYILEERERLRPVPQLRLDPYMLQRRLDVEGHDVRCVQPLRL